MEVKRKKTKWSLYSFNIGDEKIFKKIDLPNFRSSLSVYNKELPADKKIQYDYLDLPGDKVKIWRTA